MSPRTATGASRDPNPGTGGSVPYQYTIDRVEIQNGIWFDRKHDLCYAVEDYVCGLNLCNDIERNIGAP